MRDRWKEPIYIPSRYLIGLIDSIVHSYLLWRWLHYNTLSYKIVYYIYSIYGHYGYYNILTTLKWLLKTRFHSSYSSFYSSTYSFLFIYLFIHFYSLWWFDDCFSSLDSLSNRWSMIYYYKLYIIYLVKQFCIFNELW